MFGTCLADVAFHVGIDGFLPHSPQAVDEKEDDERVEDHAGNAGGVGGVFPNKGF